MEQNAFRNWLLPCSFKRLDERYEYLLPGKIAFVALSNFSASNYGCVAALASQVGMNAVRAFLPQHTLASSADFYLYLSIGFGEPWCFRAVELHAENDELYQMLGFDQQALVHFQLTSPPVVPVWVDPLMQQIRVDCWLDRIIGDVSIEWQYHFFPQEDQVWQRNILEAICQHYREHDPNDDMATSGSYQTLKCALKLLLLNYIMGHAFLVPEEYTLDLFRSLQHPCFRELPAQGDVCPRAANKFVKMMTLPLMRSMAQRTLRNLHELFYAKVPKASIWDNTFAALFLCLLVVNSTQRSVFQRALAGMERNDSSFGIRDAEVTAEAMDVELVQHLIGMFHGKFQTVSSRGGYNPLRHKSTGSPSNMSPFSARVKYVTDTQRKSTRSPNLKSG